MARALTLPVPVAGPRLPSVRHLATLGVVATLPFTYALTVPVGFPLKMYEVILCLLALLVMMQGKLVIAPGLARVVMPIVVLLTWATLVLCARLAVPLDSFTTSGFDARFGPVGDAVTKLGYWILALFAFTLVATAAYEDGTRVARWWITSAVLASVYGWCLFLSSAFNLPAPLLPGMISPAIINISGHEFYRGGTFEEGNFFALYLLTSLALALWLGKRRTAGFLVATIVITFSTVNVAGLVLFGGVYTLGVSARHRDIRRRIAGISLFAVLVVLIVAILAATGYLGAIFVAKLTTEEFGSRLDRLDLAVAGLRMSLDHPIAGVGLSHYGYNYRPYQLTDVFDRFRDVKPIANSPWIELVAETGLVGFACFAVFVRRVWQHAGSDALLPLRAGLIAVAFGLLAFPSITVLFLWAFCGLTVGLSLRNRVEARIRAT